MIAPSYLRKLSVILPAVVASSFAASSAQASEPRTSVVKCKTQSCLAVTGRRPNSEAEVSINGHPVAVDGRRKWRVLIPVETVRAWSAPLARSITVLVSTSSDSREFDTRLPIGLLGQPENLAILEISLK